MSKNKHNNQHLKQRIHEQQYEIDRLKYLNKQMAISLSEMRLHEYQQFAGVMACVHEQAMLEVITEEQAGRLMLALTGTMLCPCE